MKLAGSVVLISGANRGSGEALRDFPMYFHHLKLKMDTPEHELPTDVHLPLK